MQCSHQSPTYLSKALTAVPTTVANVSTVTNAPTVAPTVTSSVPNDLSVATKSNVSSIVSISATLTMACVALIAIVVRIFRKNGPANPNLTSVKTNQDDSDLVGEGTNSNQAILVYCKTTIERLEKEMTEAWSLWWNCDGSKKERVRKKYEVLRACALYFEKLYLFYKEMPQEPDENQIHYSYVEGQLPQGTNLNQAILVYCKTTMERLEKEMKEAWSLWWNCDGSKKELVLKKYQVLRACAFYFEKLHLFYKEMPQEPDENQIDYSSFEGQLPCGTNLNQAILLPHETTKGQLENSMEKMKKDQPASCTEQQKEVNDRLNLHNLDCK